MTSTNDLAAELSEAIQSGNLETVMKVLKRSHDGGTSNLHWIKADHATLRETCEKFRHLGISNIISIGSGSGVFEWLLSRMDPGIRVRGIEIDEPWWNSDYSIGPFIPTSYNPLYCTTTTNIGTATDMTLLFCYFNDFHEFCKYVDWFEGRWIVIIGPTKESGRHCSPMPADEMSLSKQLKLNSLIKFESNLDEIAIYSCNSNNIEHKIVEN